MKRKHFIHRTLNLTLTLVGLSGISAFGAGPATFIFGDA